MLKKADGSYALGVCNNILKSIYIGKEIPMILIKKILCHELVHATMFSYKINLETKEEESLAELIAGNYF